MRVRRFRYYLQIGVLALMGLMVDPAAAEAQDPPYSVDQVIRLIESGVFSDESILNRTASSCLGFRMNEESEAQLRAAGASDALIEGLRKVCVRLPRVIGSILVEPRRVELSIGEATQLEARLLRPDSSVIRGVPVRWVSSDTGVAAVLGDGVVMGRAVGEAVVRAAAEGGVMDTIGVRVVVREAPPAPEIVEPKSVGRAALFGAVVPGGGEFYTGNTAKGAIALVGSAGALALGLLLTSEDTIPLQPITEENCTNGTCDIEVVEAYRIEKSNRLAVGAIAAGALWVYALVDGIRTAHDSQKLDLGEMMAAASRRELELEFLPRDGLQLGHEGTLDITLVRLR